MIGYVQQGNKGEREVEGELASGPGFGGGSHGASKRKLQIIFFSVGKAESTHMAPTYSQEYGTGGEHILSACPRGHSKVLLSLFGREEERY